MYDGFIKKLLGGVRNRDGKSLQDALDEGPADYSKKLNKLMRRNWIERHASRCSARRV